MDIEKWLQEIGMSEHWERFNANKIDEETLKSMTEDDLKDIGIEALGDRKKIHNAVIELAKLSNVSDRLTNLENKVNIADEEPDSEQSRAHISIPIISLITGIIGFLTVFEEGEWDQDQIIGVIIIFALPASILGIIAIHGNAQGKGMGIAGLVLGVMTLLTLGGF
jgi:hypothetical protein